MNVKKIDHINNIKSKIFLNIQHETRIYCKILVKY